MKKPKGSFRMRLDSGQHRRIRITGAVLGLVVFVPVALRLYQLMITDYAYYSRLALSNQSRTTAVAPTRGLIYDRNMNVLADNESVENVYLDPQELRQSGADIPAMSQALGDLLGKDPAWIADQAGRLTQRYTQIAARISQEEADSLREYIGSAGIRGIHLEPSTQRNYPFGSLAAQVIGFTNTSGQGSEGIEAAYNSYLQGGAGRVITTKGNHEMDMPFSYERYLASQPGCSVILTLDATVQACLEKQIQAAIERYDVQNGAFGLVMDVNTGQILAMATLGSYDPNAYQEIADAETASELEQLRLAYLAQPEGSPGYRTGKDRYTEALTQARLKQWRNRCVSDGYEPGSTFKVLTLAAALDQGAVTLDTGFHCGGAAQIPGRAQLLHCWRSTGHGSQKTAQALQNSCNLAFANIGLRLGGQAFYEYVSRFGVLEKTGIALAGESKGVFFDPDLIRDTERWGTASLTSAAFGQTFKLTPLQLVRAIASVVNGGRLMEPYLVSEVVDAQGNTVLRQEPTLVRQTISGETSALMCTLMESVVTQGTAKNATVSGFSIGGKTGTSEKIDVFDENGQRVQDKIVSFVGVAPMDDPQYIVLVALDTPSRETGIYISGGVMAAPTVGAVMADILPYLEVARSFGPEDPAAHSLILEDMTGMDRQQAQALLAQGKVTPLFLGEGTAVTGQIPGPGTQVNGGSQVLLYMDAPIPREPVEVPDLMGMDRGQAVAAMSRVGLLATFAGNPDLQGVEITGQDISPGTLVHPGTVLVLQMTDTDAAD